MTDLFLLLSQYMDMIFLNVYETEGVLIKPYWNTNSTCTLVEILTDIFSNI